MQLRFESMRNTFLYLVGLLVGSIGVANLLHDILSVMFISTGILTTGGGFYFAFRKYQREEIEFRERHKIK